jgi:hypothetical protein
MALTGDQYGFYATGGYSLDRGFDTIALNPVVGINQYDVTNTIQIEFNVQTFNQKIGIFKDADNITLLEDASKTGIYATRYYDASNDAFYDVDSSGDPVVINEITLDASELVAGITADTQIVSVGSYSTIYSDYVSAVRTYFGYSGGFATLFANAETFDIADAFDATAFYNLLQGTDIVDSSNAYIATPTGTITISSIVEIIRSAIDGNLFANRDPSGGTTASDPSDSSNYGVADGFLAGDMIWIPAGCQIKLSVGVDAEIVGAYLNNVGPENLVSNTSSYLQSAATFSDATVSNLTAITKTVNVPMLIKLVNA